jgi:hypothetical protein
MAVTGTALGDVRKRAVLSSNDDDGIGIVFR